jgi:hypothetical protein
MRNKKSLIVTAILGTTLGWLITNLFILEISIYQYIIIEVMISLFHELYNQKKLQILNKS